MYANFCVADNPPPLLLGFSARGNDPLTMKWGFRNAYFDGNKYFWFTVASPGGYGFMELYISRHSAVIKLPRSAADRPVSLCHKLCRACTNRLGSKKFSLGYNLKTRAGISTSGEADSTEPSLFSASPILNCTLSHYNFHFQLLPLSIG